MVRSFLLVGVEESCDLATRLENIKSAGADLLIFVENSDEGELDIE